MSAAAEQLIQLQMPLRRRFSTVLTVLEEMMFEISSEEEELTHRSFTAP